MSCQEAPAYTDCILSDAKENKASLINEALRSLLIPNCGLSRQLRAYTLSCLADAGEGSVKRWVKPLPMRYKAPLVSCQTPGE